MEAGTRVIAILSATAGVVRSYGEGVYAGDFSPPVEHGFGESTNPRIDLDSGLSIWGFECWWGPVDKTRARFPASEWRWEAVDIEANRKAAEAAEIERLRDVLQRLFDYHGEAAPGCHTEYLAAVADAADILSDVRGRADG